MLKGRYDVAFTRPPLVAGLETRTLISEPVAADVGITRLARSAGGLRRTGVVFVPLAGEFVPTEMVWSSGNTSPALRGLLDVVTELAASTDLTESG